VCNPGGGPKELPVTVKLQVEVTRDVDQRLVGTVRLDDWQLAFDGTLELMRVFEEFVPSVSAMIRTKAGAARAAEAGCRPSE
jgi:hypothetical protein